MNDLQHTRARTDLGGTTAALFLAAALATTTVPAMASTTAGTAERQSPEVTIDQLLESSGTKDHLASLAKYVALEATELHELDDRERAAVGRAIARSFEQERLVEAMTHQLVGRFDAVAAEAALEWYRSAAGQKVRETEVKALANKKGIDNYLKTYESYPPSPARQDLAKRYLVATRRGDVALLSSLAVTDSAVRGLRALTLGDQETESQEHVDHYMANKKDELERAIERRENFRVLYMHGRLMLNDIQALVDFLETPAGQWLYTTIYLGLDETLDDASRRFVASLHASATSSP